MPPDLMIGSDRQKAGTHISGSGPLARLDYEHDILGDILSRREQLGFQGNTGQDETDLYQYDLTRQLTQATYGHRDNQLDESEAFAWDPVGNRESWITGDETLNQISEEIDYIDPNGNDEWINALNQYTEIESSTEGTQLPG